MAGELSEDPRDWPRDPFQLLGVEPGATETDIKRAYTRLIRRFKPEHFPEQFRRIREAYENALERFKWRGFFTPSMFAPPSSGEPEKNTPQESVEAKPRPVSLDPVDTAWALVTEGKAADAYERLVALHHTQPDRPELALRLYWLLAVYPALDENRTRHDWLAAALKASRLTGAAVELYQRELEGNRETALMGPYLRLLECEATPGALLAAARLRLAMAGRCREWMSVDIDLAALATRAATFDEVAWLSHLGAAMGYLVFAQSQTACGRCRGLLTSLEHLQLRESWVFDQVDEQEAFAKLWSRGVAVPVPVREVVFGIWASAGMGWQWSLNQAAAWVREDPTTALNQLDKGADDYDSRPLLNAFRQLLARCWIATEPTYPPGVIRGFVRVFLARPESWNYPGIRSELLKFLIDEVIAPEELIHACSVDPDRGPRTLALSLRNDAMLQLAWRTAIVTKL